jgi:pimeloyl-ACP methyl ester carboxylesterase
MRSGFIRAGQIDLQFELIDYTLPWRDKPPETILMHHGYARNMLFWQPLIPLLCRDYRLLRFNARGSSETRTDPPAEGYSIGQFSHDAIHLMDALGIDRVHWIGESSGGIVGLNSALNHGSRLRSLILCDTPFKRPDSMYAVYSSGEQDREAAFRKYGVDGWCRRTLSYRMDTNKASAALCNWYVEQMGRTPIPVAVALERMIGAGDLWPDLPSISVPTLILAGEKSPIVSEAMMNEMKQRMPRARLKTLAGYGHGVNLVAPDECATEIKAFIGGLQ